MNQHSYLYNHPEDPDFIHELSEKLETIQPVLGEAISIHGQLHPAYELTKPGQRKDVILYLLFCEPLPDREYSRYATPKPINGESLQEVIVDTMPPKRRYTIEPCDSPCGCEPGIKCMYKFVKLTGLEYITLLFLYQNRDRKLENWQMNEFYWGYEMYVRMNYDPTYNLPENNVKEIRNKLARVYPCLLYTSPSPRDATLSRMPSSA